MVIRDKATLAQITEWHPYAKMLPSAPVAVLVCGDPGEAKWAVLWPQDCSACVENMLIEAELLGLGAVWLGIHPLPEREAALRGLLGIPEHVVPFAIVPVRLAAGAQAPLGPLRRGAHPPRALVSGGRLSPAGPPTPRRCPTLPSSTASPLFLLPRQGVLLASDP